MTVSHSAQETSSVPSSRATTWRREPQSAHSGPPSAGAEDSGERVGASESGAEPSGTAASRIVEDWWHPPQVPVSTRAV